MIKQREERLSAYSRRFALRTNRWTGQICPANWSLRAHYPAKLASQLAHSSL